MSIPTRKAVMLAVGVFGLLCSIVTVTLCALYKDHQNNSLTCEISDVTDVTSIYKNGKISWFFQYNYRGVNCTESEGTYTIYESSYDQAIETREHFVVMTNTTCYARKNGDQCDVSMNDSVPDGYYFGIIFGSCILVLSVCWILFVGFCPDGAVDSTDSDEPD
jgi:hypothetical protein